MRNNYIFQCYLDFSAGLFLGWAHWPALASGVNAKLKLSSQIWYQSSFLTPYLISLKSQTLPFMSRDSQLHIQAAK